MHRLKEERGQALVEFALILPVLLAIVIGVFDLGSAWNNKNDLNFLANEAVRYAEVNSCAPCSGSGSNAIRDYVKATADTNRLQNSVSITFSLPNGSQKVGDPVKVTVCAPYDYLGHLPGLPSSTITIRSTVTARILQAPDATNGHPALYTTGTAC